MTHTDKGLRKKLYKYGKRWVVGTIAATLLIGGPMTAVSLAVPEQRVAAATTTSGTDSSMSWSLNNGVLTLLGGPAANRATATSAASLNPWNKWASEITTLVISPGTVLPTSAKYLFAGLPNLTKITGLENLDFSKTTDITGLFSGDAKLTSLTFPANINNATAKNLFSGMTSLQTLDLTNFQTGTAPASGQLDKWLDGDTALKSIIFGPKVFSNTASPLSLPGPVTWYDQNDTKQTTYTNLSTSGKTTTSTYSVSTRVVNYVDASGKVLYTDTAPANSSSYTVVDPWNTSSPAYASLSKYVFAQTDGDPLTAFGPTEPITVEAGQTVTIQMQSIATTANPTGYKGVNNAGSSDPVKYYLDQSGVLHFGSGTFANTTAGSTTSPWVSQMINIKGVIFDGHVKAAPISAGLFGGLMFLQTYQGLDNLDTSAVADMSAVFYYNQYLETGLEGISTWDTSHVTNMSRMFTGLNLLVDPSSVSTVLDFTTWDTRQVTNMTGMFNGAQAKQIIFGANFKTDRVIGGTADGSTVASKNGEVLLPERNSSLPATAGQTKPWRHITDLNDNLVTDPTDYTIYNSSTMQPGTYIRGEAAFSSVIYHDPDQVELTALTTKKYGALGNRITLTSKDPWSSDNMEDFDYVYYDASDPQKAYSVGTSIPAIVGTDNLNVTVQHVQAKGILSTSDDAVKWYLDDAGVLHLSGGTLDNAGTSPWGSVASKITSIKIDGAITVGANASNLFAGLTNLTTIAGTDQLDMSAVTDMSHLFDGDSALQTLDVSSWNVGQVQNMASAFAGVSALSTLDVAQWDTSHVTDMTDLFRGMSSLTALDVAKWTTSSVQLLNGAFAGLTKVTSLALGDPTDASSTAWSTAQLTEKTLTDLFAGSGLQQVTFGQHFSDAAGVTVTLPSASAKVWLDQTTGEALINDQYLTGTDQPGTYTLTPVTYQVVFHDSETGKDLATVAGEPITSNMLGQPINVDEALKSLNGYLVDDDPLPTLATKFTLVAGEWTQTLTVNVHEEMPPMHYPEAGSDARLALMAIGTVIGLAGLAGILLLKRKAFKED